MTTRCKDSGAGESNVSSPAMSRKHVLIVDDDDCTRSTLSTYLTRERYVVSVARTGREGLRLAKEGLPDVILLDFRLSDMDGLTYLRTLRRESPGDVSAVVVFTADWTLYDRRTDLQSLQAMLASKLCDIKELGELIKYLSSRGT
jgi:DNA-binding response OmpR family regulator